MNLKAKIRVPYPFRVVAFGLVCWLSGLACCVVVGASVLLSIRGFLGS